MICTRAPPPTPKKKAILSDLESIVIPLEDTENLIGDATAEKPVSVKANQTNFTLTELRILDYLPIHVLRYRVLGSLVHLAELKCYSAYTWLGLVFGIQLVRMYPVCMNVTPPFPSTSASQKTDNQNKSKQGQTYTMYQKMRWMYYLTRSYMVV